MQITKKSAEAIEKGKLLLENREFSKALALFNSVMSDSPHCDNVRLLTAKTMLGMRQYGETLRIVT